MIDDRDHGLIGLRWIGGWRRSSRSNGGCRRWRKRVRSGSRRRDAQRLINDAVDGQLKCLGNLQGVCLREQMIRPGDCGAE